jgi:hypothetical protein
MFYIWSVIGCTTYTLIILILSAAILIAFKMSVLMLFVTTPAVLILIIVILGVNRLYIMLEKSFITYTLIIIMMRAVILITIIIMMSVMLFVSMPAFLILIIVILGANMSVTFLLIFSLFSLSNYSSGGFSNKSSLNDSGVVGDQVPMPQNFLDVLGVS